MEHRRPPVRDSSGVINCRVTPDHRQPPQSSGGAGPSSYQAIRSAAPGINGQSHSRAGFNSWGWRRSRRAAHDRVRAGAANRLTKGLYLIHRTDHTGSNRRFRPVRVPGEVERAVIQRGDGAQRVCWLLRCRPSTKRSQVHSKSCQNEEASRARIIVRRPTMRTRMSDAEPAGRFCACSASEAFPQARGDTARNSKRRGHRISLWRSDVAIEKRHPAVSEDSWAKRPISVTARNHAGPGGCQVPIHDLADAPHRGRGRAGSPPPLSSRMADRGEDRTLRIALRAALISARKEKIAV